MVTALPHPNPVNLWSYKGLEMASRAQGRTEDARRAFAWFEAAATASDVQGRITASEF